MIRVFFAIPCGGFYDLQATAIRRTAEAMGIDCVIAEDDVQTKELWKQITALIDHCDYFVADITADSKNIAFELGYALARKSPERIGIFISSAASDPADLRGFLLQRYVSLADFEHRLREWLSAALGLSLAPAGRSSSKPRIAYEEEFRDSDRFLRIWSVPPGAAFHLAADGLKVGDTHWPILTTQLGLVHDCEVEFTAKINKAQIGWSFMGTRRPNGLLPTFCAMFALRGDGRLAPHLWSESLPGPPEHGGYHRYPDRQISLRPDRRGWFSIITRIRKSRVTLLHDGREVSNFDFDREPFRAVYRSVQLRQGNVGFRCFLGEEATISRLVVRESAQDARPSRRRV